MLKETVKYFISPLLKKYDILNNQIEENRILTARILINEMRKSEYTPENISDFEFKVFSQRGEDGIIQYLISRVAIYNPVFVEFGVEDYTESNTRFLMVNNNWQGLIMDSDEGNIKKIKKRDIFWQYDITAVNAFITKENINKLIESNGINGDIGLLSIDIDGNDYWIWEAINIISPRIVICEYNSVFGYKEAVTVPYSERFNRTEKHYSNLYFGASLKALCILAQKKGYIFVGSNSAGSNAFFVREDTAQNLKPVDCEKGYVESKFRESRDKSGNLTFLSGKNRINQIGDLYLFDVITKQGKRISELDI
ncbi:MAG: hypothetical protein R6W90_09840 [Ignavibacteriaceae bacterium]